MAGCLAAFVLALPALTAWLDPALDLASAGDAGFHLVRLYHFDWLLARGDWYPRWVPDMFLGYGYPLWNYYAPAFYYLAWGLRHALRLDFIEALRASGVACVLLGTAGAYALAYHLWRRVAAALVAALALAYGPYVFQISLYKRGALPETLGLALIPWLLYAIYRLWGARAGRESALWSAAAAVAGAALVLSHNLTAMTGFGVAALWLAPLAAASHASHRRRPLLHACGALAIAVGLSSFFWIPVVAEARLVHLDLLWGAGGADWASWFVEPTGDTDRDQSPDNLQTPYGWIDRHLFYPHQLVAAPKISLGQASLGALTALVLAGTLLRWLMGWRPMRAQRRNRPSDAEGLVVRVSAVGAVAAFFGVALLCWVFTFSGTRALWHLFPPLQLLQFPWRLLGPGSIALSLASAGALALLAGGAERRWGGRGAAVGSAATLLVGAAFVANSQGPRAAPTLASAPARVDGEYLVTNERAGPSSAGTGSGLEFLPRDVVVPDYTYAQRRHVSMFEHLYPDAEWLGGLLRPLASPSQSSADLRFLAWRARPGRLAVRVANDSNQAGALGVRQLRFAGWRAWVDGRAVAPGVPDHVPEQQTSPGFLAIDVPPGEHTLDLAFGPSAPRALGLGVTLVSVLVLAALLVRAAPPWDLHPLTATRATDALRWLLPCAAALLAAWGCWRDLRLAGRDFAALPLPAPRMDATGVWAANDLGDGGSGAGLVVNIAEATLAGGAHIAAPSSESLGPESFVDVRHLTVTDDDPLRGAAGTARRQMLYMHPPAAVSIDVALPLRPQVYFQSTVALDPRTWDAPTGDGVRFLVSVKPLGDSQTAPGAVALDVEINPRARREQRRWVPVSADLSPWAGQTVRLALSTRPRDDPSFDWAGWGDPVVAVLDTARAPLGPRTSP